MSYDSQYAPADTSFVVNCGHPNGTMKDPSLTPIRISLPKPPPIHLIEGYGLPPSEQYWRKPILPKRLIELENRVKKDLEQAEKNNPKKTVNGYKVITEIWETLKINPKEYREEIKWIKRQWWHRIYGYWFFINGKPTYVPGSYYFYLSWWKIEGRLYPEYRDRDRKTQLFWHYTKTTHETFKYLDKDGKAIGNDDGTYEMRELPVRTFYGPVQPKGRRFGVSNMSQCDQYEQTSRHRGDIGVIFSLDETSASKLFIEKTVESWSHMPFFFLPTFDGYFQQKTQIEFKKPKHVVYGDELNSFLTFALSAFGNAFDGGRLTHAIFDESGKTKLCNVDDRWITHKNGLSVGDSTDIIGTAIHISTTEDLEEMGGKHFQTLCYDSDFYVRSPLSGQTKTGLALLFLPSIEGAEKFVGKYGESIIDNPTPQQIADGFQFDHGSYNRLMENRDALLHSKDPMRDKKWRQHVVKFPIFLDECFMLTKGSDTFDLKIISKRKSELRKIKEPFIKGNLKRVNPKDPDSNVIFVPSSDGKFEFSKILPENETNLRTKDYIYDELTYERKQIWKPLYPNRYTIGADPFQYKGDDKFEKQTGSYQSDGGITVLWERDHIIDPGDNMYEWESDRCVCFYRERPRLLEEYLEDVIMCAQYFGGYLCPETNISNLWQYIVKRGYEGYLLYLWDEQKQKQNERPGIYNLEASKEEGWSEFVRYIEFRGHKERHERLLTEIANLKQFSDLRKNDGASSFMCALLGSKNRIRPFLQDQEKADVDLGDFYASGFSLMN
jgi:hypothetical protein